jgi:hypothetical protein
LSSSKISSRELNCKTNNDKYEQSGIEKHSAIG